MHAEFLKWYITLLIIAVVLYFIIESQSKEVKILRKRTLIYGAVVALFIGIVPLVGYLGLRDITLVYFIVIQALIFIVGVLHARYLYKTLDWTSSQNFFSEFLYTTALVCLGSVLQLFCLVSLNLVEDQFLFMSSVVWLFVPFFFMLAFNTYQAIPEMNFLKWRYPIDQVIDPPSDQEMADLVVITFEFYKNASDNEKTIFRAKAPLQMSLGRLFYYFINDYNERHPEGSIQVSQKSNDVFEWLFYKKRKWYQQLQHLDFNESMINNNIKENSIIICKRVN